MTSNSRLYRSFNADKCIGFTCDTYGSCRCPVGRTGADCSIINPCKSGSNMAVCINATASAMCSGTTLYGIVNCPYGCKYSTGECDCSTRCKMHGVCNSQGTCSCDLGYYGHNCEYASPCYNDPDKYGYSCQG